MFHKKYPRKDELTHEWFFNGKWYENYPGKEVEDYNEKYERYLEQKFDEMREEQKKGKPKVPIGNYGF